MKYGNDDLSGQDEVRRQQEQSRRFIRLSLMAQPKLAAEYLRVKQLRGIQMHPTEGAHPPRTKQELITAIIRMEKDGTI